MSEEEIAEAFVLERKCEVPGCNNGWRRGDYNGRCSCTKGIVVTALGEKILEFIRSHTKIG